eukprot:scaffold112076_cov30-Tisochrysis_lutea.AAC.3
MLSRSCTAATFSLRPSHMVSGSSSWLQAPMEVCRLSRANAEEAAVEAVEAAEAAVEAAASRTDCRL